MSKKFWVYILSAVIFLSTVLLSISTVYRVDTVTLDVVAVSDLAKAEAEELQESLYKAYNKRNILFVDEENAKDIMADYPQFRFVSFEKSYPNRLIIKAREDAEMYAVATGLGEGGYYILGPDGIVLGVRDSYINRLDGEDNVLLSGLTITGVENGLLSGDKYMESLLAFCQKASEVLGGIRRNVVSIEVIRLTSNEDDTVFRVNTREGVKIYIGFPLEQPAEKAVAAFEKYLSLTPEKRMKGRIAVAGLSGEWIVSYSEKDDFIA